MSPPPRLSVLLPCRNAASTLPDTIESLRTQTLSDFEVVAVDDGSADATGRILAHWAAVDPRVHVLSSPAIGGAAASLTGANRLVPALNRAAAAARAPLLARMDADDISAPTRLEAQLAFLDGNRDLAAVGAHVELFPGEDVGSGYRRYEAWINSIATHDEVERSALIECPIAHPTLVIRASVFRAIGGYRDTGWPEDYDLVLRLLAAGTRLANVPEQQPLLRWRVAPDRHSLTAAVYAPAAFRRCRVHFLREAFLPPGRPVVIWGAGRVGKPLGRELVRQGTRVAAFVDLDPRREGQEIHGAQVFSPGSFARRADVKAPDRASAPRPYVLAAVGSPGVRPDIRAALHGLGFEEIRDFRFCA